MFDHMKVAGRFPMVYTPSRDIKDVIKIPIITAAAMITPMTGYQLDRFAIPFVALATARYSVDVDVHYRELQPFRTGSVPTCGYSVLLAITNKKSEPGCSCKRPSPE